MGRRMLTFERIKAIEKALGREAAGPVIQALETIGDRARAEMASELATRRDLAETKLEIIKWAAGLLVAQAAVAPALVKLL